MDCQEGQVGAQGCREKEMVEMTMEVVGFNTFEWSVRDAFSCVKGHTHLLISLLKWSDTPHSYKHWSAIHIGRNKMTQEDKIYLIVGSCLPESPKPYEVIISPKALNHIKEIIK
jgi:hypothetical protein